ncbi:hypothetical protein WJU23_13670 [Prosthecobacter sp. SYSU 5D2]|uniref:hypothetical protein n=1 Tax=Prosthecobacter sp. SYSU 5D2 TaxID=3134134 RepID=UPI0031FF0189
MDENLKAALEVAQILDELKVPWFLGGSLASSIYGVPRATLDADIVANLRPSHALPLVKNLGEDWYADEAAIREAITSRTSFNLINMNTALKVDVFAAKFRAFEQGQFTRIQLIHLAGEDGPQIKVTCREDMIAAKLEWFRLGDEISDRQWQDILGMIRLQGASLDMDLLVENARELKVQDLLDRAITEAEMR